MSKSITLVIIALLLSATLSQASRPQPKDVVASAQEDVEKINDANPDEGAGVDMVRETLEAHTDYIYTQGAKH